MYSPSAGFQHTQTSICVVDCHITVPVVIRLAQFTLLSHSILGTVVTDAVVYTGIVVTT